MLVVVFNPLCPVWFSLLLYCIYFCFSVPNKTISISISISKMTARTSIDRTLRVYAVVHVMSRTVLRAGWLRNMTTGNSLNLLFSVSQRVSIAYCPLPMAATAAAVGPIQRNAAAIVWCIVIHSLSIPVWMLLVATMINTRSFFLPETGLLLFIILMCCKQ